VADADQGHAARRDLGRHPQLEHGAQAVCGSTANVLRTTIPHLQSWREGGDACLSSPKTVCPSPAARQEIGATPAQQRRSTVAVTKQHCCHGSHATHAERCAAQAYKYWLQGEHPFLFLVNNDVLVPSGVLTKLMDGMRDDGAGKIGCDVLVSVP